jgi:hypothetical protein
MHAARHLARKPIHSPIAIAVGDSGWISQKKPPHGAALVVSAPNLPPAGGF